MKPANDPQAECLCCEAQAPVEQAEGQGWQRGACTCDDCPTGAVWLCPDHRVDQEAA